jgi:hypothetical protein
MVLALINPRFLNARKSFIKKEDWKNEVELCRES